MPEPGRVLTREQVEAMQQRSSGGGWYPYAGADVAALARSHEQLREAAEYVRDASLITADDAMLTDALGKLDVVLSMSEKPRT